MLQPAYTAATYFHFQDTIVRDPKVRYPCAAFNNKSTALDLPQHPSDLGQSIREINERHLMVRDGIDEKPFPALRLHRCVVRDEQEKRQFDGLVVRALSLEPQEGDVASKHR